MDENCQAFEIELGRFFDYALDLLCLGNVEGRFIRVNQAWEKALGYRRDELEGIMYIDLVHPDDRDATLVQMAALGAQKQVLGFVNRYRSASGAWRWIEWNSFSIGKLVYAAARDITQRIEGERELRAALAEKELLLKELGHRIKNSLAIIASLVSLEGDRVGEGEGKACLGRLQNRIQATGLLYDKLCHAKGPLAVDAAEYLGDLAELVARNLEPTDGSIALETDLAPLEIDSTRAIDLGLAANEAITNCYKHAFAEKRAGHIRVSLAVDDGKARFSIEDDGSGFPAGFDPARDGDLGFGLIAIEAGELGGELLTGPGQCGTGARVEIAFPVTPLSHGTIAG